VRMRVLTTMLAMALVATGASAAATAAASGTVDDRPSGLTAFFRSGQTFLTWDEVDGDAAYRIYRSSTPFADEADLTADALVATVGDETSLDLAASIDRLAADAGDYRIPIRVHYSIVDNGPQLSDDTGLFVFTAKQDEIAYYAVTAVVGGVEVGGVEPGVNALGQGVAEQVGPVVPVRQNDEADYVHWTDDVGTSYYPAMSRAPSVPYTFRVRRPDGDGPFPLIGVLHGLLFQYDTPDSLRYAKVDADHQDAVHVALDSPVLSAADVEGLDPIDVAGYPTGGGWYGWIEPGSSGPNDKIAQRVLWTLDQVERTEQVDPHRVSLTGESVGAIGSMVLAFTHPDRFAAIHAYVPYLRQRAGSLRALFPLDLLGMLDDEPAEELPYLMLTAGRLDQVMTWPEKPAFLVAAGQAGRGVTLYWDGRGHSYTENPALFPYAPVWGQPDGLPTEHLTGFATDRSYPALSGLTADSDPGTVDLARPPAVRPPLDSPGIGDLVGTINGGASWDNGTVVDELDRYAVTLRLTLQTDQTEATATVTPRRLQEFELVPGDAYGYTVIDATGTGLVAGEGTVGPDGLIRVPDVPLNHDGTRLTVWRQPACTQVVDGRHVGPLTLTDGVTCLTGATVVGPIQVRPGATLVAEGARIHGPVSASQARLVRICDTEVTGPVSISASQSVMVDDSAVGCVPNRIVGPVRIG
jgi:predicted esterase